MTTILIVDDIDENLYLLRYILQKNKFNVISANNGIEALEIATENPPDLIISDILMPVMDGFTLCRNWQKNPSLKDIPFIIYTATYTEEEDRKLALEIGADRFIIKPQEPDVMVDLVIEVLTDFEKGIIVKKDQIVDEVVILKEYNERLINKIEKKLNDLEALNKQLDESKAELSHIFSRISEGFFALDNNWKFSYVNKKVGEMYDCHPEKLIGKDIFKEPTISIDSKLKKAYKEALTEQKYVKIETFNKKFNKWYENHIYPTIDGLSIYFSDITEKKKALEIIEQSEEFNIGILNSLSAKIVVVDRHGEILAVNEPWKKFTSKEETNNIHKLGVGDNYLNVLKDSISNGDILAKASLEGINEVLLGIENSFYQEYPSHTENENRWFSMRVMKFEKGKTMLVIEHQNITERKKIEEDLNYNQKILNEAQVLGKISNWEIDFKSGNSFWSDELYTIFGATKETIASPQNFISFIHPEDKEYVSNKITKAFKSLNDDSFSAKTIAVNGVVKHIFSEYKFEFDDQNNPIRLYGILQDVTSSVLSEKAIIDKNSELKKANKELDRFVYNTSHDLRAPLKSILGLTDLIKEEMVNEDVDQKERMDMIKNSVLKLDDFIEDVLIYSKNTRLEIEHEDIIFNELIEEIRESHKYMENADDVDLIHNVNQNLVFKSDKFRIKTILNNLVSNAIKYQRKSEERSYVKVTIEIMDSKCFITVQDNGIGIPKEKKERVFEMFYRATIKSTGSGLGLYIVKDMVEKLMGKIEVESNYGIGTKFHIEIPITTQY